MKILLHQIRTRSWSHNLWWVCFLGGFWMEPSAAAQSELSRDSSVWSLPHVHGRVLALFPDRHDFQTELNSLSPVLLRFEPISPDSSGWIIESSNPESRLDEKALSELAYAAGAVVVEPDFLVDVFRDPNDPAYFNRLKWGLNNLGQNGGLNDADIDAREAWDIREQAADVIIAIIDTGARITHEDLKENLWTNPSEIAGNGIDDDLNGYVDDVHGINAAENSGDPKDDHGHGTHLAGIIGARGNNARGSVGVVWRCQLMPLKFMDSSGSGSTTDAIKCIDYAIRNQAHVINASWGNVGQSFFLERAVRRTFNAGVVFVTAAGNAAQDIEETPNYPASYAFDNLITVCATTENDNIVSFSNYGSRSVDLGAPGASIYSTYFSSDTSYHKNSGSSMSAAFVSGAVALLMAEYPEEGYAKWKEAILESVDPLPALSGKTLTGGRLNLNSALQYLDQSQTVLPAVLEWIAESRQIKITGSPETLYAMESSTDGQAWTLVQAVLTAPDGIGTVEISSMKSPVKWFRAISVE